MRPHYVRTHGVSLLRGAAAAGSHIHPDGAMLDLSGGPPSIGVLHLSDEDIFVSHADIFADMLHLGTDVDVKKVQTEVSVFVLSVWRAL